MTDADREGSWGDTQRFLASLFSISVHSAGFEVIFVYSVLRSGRH